MRTNAGRFCLYCGQPLPKARRKYCGDDCRDYFWQEHITPLLWQNARENAMRRAGGKCEKCGGMERVEVHHILPLRRGETRWKNEKNRQENLLVLCGPHHDEYRRKAKALKEQMALEF